MLLDFYIFRTLLIFLVVFVWFLYNELFLKINTVLKVGINWMLGRNRKLQQQKQIIVYLPNININKT